MYIEKILLPYVNRKREELKLKPDHPALVIFDKFTGQGTESLLELLEANHIHVVMVSANCTDRLQPLDVIVNKSAKNFLQQQFQKWYAEQICEHAAPREAQCCFSGFTIECREATGSTVDD